MRDGRLREHPVDPERLGVVFGANMIPCELEELVGTSIAAARWTGRFDFSRGATRRWRSCSRLWMLKYLPNMPACHIGIAQDARGPNNSVVLGDVSSLAALAEASRISGPGPGRRDHRRRRSARGFIPPCGSEASPSGLSQRGDDPAAASPPVRRPARRHGVRRRGGGPVSGNPAHAARAAPDPRPHPRLVPRPSSPAATARPSRARPSAARSRARLRDARMAPADVGFVMAHGLSTLNDDRIEAQAIRDTLGDVPVTAPKSCFGHLGAGSGALEAAAERVGVAERAGPAHAELPAARPAMPRECRSTAGRCPWIAPRR